MFREVKCLVTTTPVFSYYHLKVELGIQYDASKKGLGAALLQRGKLITYTSRALTETEQRYTQIEKGMLVSIFSPEKFNQHTYRPHVKIQSDHKPLESILKKSLACTPKRLQCTCMMMRLDPTAWRADVDFNAPSKIGKLLAQILLFYRGTSDRAVV